jgi:hypothetical protein
MPGSITRKTSQLMTALVCVAVSAAVASAQAKSTGGGFVMGYTDIGPTVGLGGLNGGASASFGGRFEHAIKPLPDLGNGMLGIQVAAEYYSFSDVNFSAKFIPIGVTANYHFHLDEPKIDPFVGLGLGYDIESCSFPGSSSFGCGFNSGIYFIGRAGVRYFFAPAMAAYADVGAGGATLNVGIMFKLH